MTENIASMMHLRQRSRPPGEPARLSASIKSLAALGAAASATTKLSSSAATIHARRQVNRPAPSLGGLHARTSRLYIQRSPTSVRRIVGPPSRPSTPARGHWTATADLAQNFTTGELAALKIVADECLAHGACDLSKNEIGATGRGL